MQQNIIFNCAIKVNLFNGTKWVKIINYHVGISKLLTVTDILDILFPVTMKSFPRQNER